MSDHLARWREKLSLTQHTVATVLGVSRALVQRWERGRCPVAPGHVARLATLLQVDPWAICLAGGVIPGDLEVEDPEQLASVLRSLYRVE